MQGWWCEMRKVINAMMGVVCSSCLQHAMRAWDWSVAYSQPQLFFSHVLFVIDGQCQWQYQGFNSNGALPHQIGKRKMQTIEQIARKVRRMASHLTVAEQDAIIANRVASSNREAARAAEPAQPIMRRRVTATGIVLAS